MGRRRRWSNSTVATVDEETICYLNETAVLKKISPEDNAWESNDFSFVLEDVSVYNKKGELGNLLSVAFDGPFTVRGHIVPEDDQKHHFLKRNVKSAYLSIEGCTRYSVGQGSEDCNPPCIWAAGECGWFEIRPPAPEYRQIYSKMAYAVSLYYFLQDVHKTYEKEQRKRKPKKGPKKPKREDIMATLDIETTFLKCAVLAGDGSTLEELQAACDDHAPFLISQFHQDEALPPGDSEKVNWQHTTFYKWLTSRHPDVVAQVTKMGTDKAKAVPEVPATETPSLLDDPPPQKALSKPAPAPKPKSNLSKKETRESVASSRPSRRSQSRSSPEIVETESRDFAMKRRSRSLRSSDEAKDQTPIPPSNAFAPDTSTMDIDPVEVVDHPPPALEDPDQEMQDAAVGTPAQMLLTAVERIAADSEKSAKSLTYGYIKSNLYMKYKMKKYDTAADILEYYAAELLPMLDKTRWAATGFFNDLQRKAQGPRKEPEHFSLADVSLSLQRRTKAEPRNPPAKSLPPRSTIMEVETPQQRKRGRPAGKMSSLRPSNKKRILDASGDGIRGFKYGHPSYLADQEVEEDDSDILEDSLDEDDEDPTMETPVPVKIILEAEKIPDLIAKGPNGTWVCDQDDDCAFVERNPEDADGKARIEQHIEKEHTDESRTERINLAMIEGGRGHLPVDHLLEKIRRMGAKVEQEEEILVNSKPLSRPVKRRLLV